MTSGLCLASSLGTVFGIERFRPLEKRHAILAVLSLTTAFLIIALDLHYPIRMVLGAVFVPSPSSPMWWMGVFYGVYLVVLLVEVWSMFTPPPQDPPVRVHHGRRASRSSRRSRWARSSASWTPRPSGSASSRRS